MDVIMDVIIIRNVKRISLLFDFVELVWDNLRYRFLRLKGGPIYEWT